MKKYCYRIIDKNGSPTMVCGSEKFDDKEIAKYWLDIFKHLYPQWGYKLQKIKGDVK